MGDAGEGLIDAEARIQERMDEIAEARAGRQAPPGPDPAASRALESLRLARADLQRQYAATAHERRRHHITEALAEIDRQIKSAIGDL